MRVEGARVRFGGGAACAGRRRETELSSRAARRPSAQNSREFAARPVRTILESETFVSLLFDGGGSLPISRGAGARSRNLARVMYLKVQTRKPALGYAATLKPEKQFRAPTRSAKGIDSSSEDGGPSRCLRPSAETASGGCLLRTWELDDVCSRWKVAACGRLFKERVQRGTTARMCCGWLREYLKGTNPPRPCGELRPFPFAIHKFRG
jgi:hypothetical protein